jgi:predicted ATP-grasp superfamily ATP-dependent carboligase/protein-tyrosine-phosphatase
MRTEAHAGVILTDGNERSALAATRSLGRRGVPVFVGAESRASLAGASRYCREVFTYPSPWTRPDEFAGCVLEHARRWGTRVALPMTDLAVEILGEAIPRAGAPLVLPIASLQQHRAVSNKYELMRSARGLGVPVPDTAFVADGDVDEALAQVKQWPVVIKPGRSLFRSNGQWLKTSVHYAQDAEELRNIYRRVGYLRQPSLLQARILGEGQGVFGLFDHGRPVAWFAHRRLRERPPSGGVSVLCESMPLRAALVDHAQRILQSTGWHGVAMVEFKLDAKSGIAYLMEVNGRFWGSLQLAIDAGVDFPWLLYQLATAGAAQPPAAPYATGVRSRWWLGDLDHLLLRLRKADRELNLPPGAPSRWSALGSFLRAWDPRTKGDVLRLRDPRPGVHELTTYAAHATRRLRATFAARVMRMRAGLLRLRWNTALTRQKLPARVERVLVLCKGNICRSPFAAELLRKRAADRGIRLEVCSAGLDTTPGHDAYPLAKTTSHTYGVDLDRHRTNPLTTEMIRWADVVLVMEAVQLLQLRDVATGARAKTFLLGQFASSATTDIRDPYTGTPDDFQRCYAVIQDACEGFLGSIVDGVSAPAANCSR